MKENCASKLTTKAIKDSRLAYDRDFFPAATKKEMHSMGYSSGYEFATSDAGSTIDKAKEIIRRAIITVKDHPRKTDMDIETINRAEAFLKEQDK